MHWFLSRSRCATLMGIGSWLERVTQIRGVESDSGGGDTAGGAVGSGNGVMAGWAI